MRSLRILTLATLIGIISIPPVSAYYHYIYYTGRTPSGGPIPVKYDLSALPNKTVTFFVTDVGPTRFPVNDSFNSVLSQIRQAAATWNSVSTSDLRVAFGGLYNASTPPSSTPGGNVVFEDLPPGFLGFGGPTFKDTSGIAAGNFVPMSRSTIFLTNDLTNKPGPSYSESFFLTAVHEMGHSLGLQHTYTSSAMSTDKTRTTSVTRPIDADDIAGLSVLYPAAAFGLQTGSIAGRVAVNGTGVHMASVVAIRSGFGAVSALTSYDGSYRIDGVPPGQYYVYAHPLPPQTTASCDDICAPLDANSQAVPASGPFNTAFYPGTTNIVQATPVSVTAGGLNNIGTLNVKPRNDVPVYGVKTFSFFGNNAVTPGFLNMSAQGDGNILVGGTGLAANGKISTGLTVQVMGGAANVYGFIPYVDDTGFTYLNVGVNYSLGASVGPQHLIFTLGDFIYILPSGPSLVSNRPPAVTSAFQNSDNSVTVTGSNFGADTLIYFNGLPAAIRSLDPVAGRAVVVPPPGGAGLQAAVTAYNHDGQNSSFLQAGSPVTYFYNSSAAPSFTMNPSSLPAGSEAAITITGANTQFVAGQTIAGFGSSDVFVRNVIVQRPDTILVNVSIPPGAATGASEVSLISGFQLAAQQQAFQITPVVNRQQPSVIPQLQNVSSGQTGAYPGALVSFSGLNLESGNGPPTITLNGIMATVISASQNQITLQLPASLSAGTAAILSVDNGQSTSLPVAVNIDSLPATIVAVGNSSGVPYSATRGAHGGDVVNVLLTGFADPSMLIFPSRVSVNVGGVSLPAIQVSPQPNGLFQVSFVLSNLVPTGQQTPITVYLDDRSSYTATISTTNP